MTTPKQTTAATVNEYPEPWDRINPAIWPRVAKRIVHVLSHAPVKRPFRLRRMLGKLAAIAPDLVSPIFDPPQAAQRGLENWPTAEEERAEVLRGARIMLRLRRRRAKDKATAPAHKAPAAKVQAYADNNVLPLTAETIVATAPDSCRLDLPRARR